MSNLIAELPRLLPRAVAWAQAPYPAGTARSDLAKGQNDNRTSGF